MPITSNQLRAIMPHNTAAPGWTPILNAAMNEYEIAVNTARVAAFLAQVAHESGEMTRLRESLWYSTARGICDTWPKRFPTLDSAAPYVSTKARPAATRRSPTASTAAAWATATSPAATAGPFAAAG